jgi:hypothetical protein
MPLLYNWQMMKLDSNMSNSRNRAFSLALKSETAVNFELAGLSKK